MIYLSIILFGSNKETNIIFNIFTSTHVYYKLDQYCFMLQWT